LSSVQSHKIIGGEKEAQESAGGSSLVDVRPLNDGLDQETLDILEKGVTYATNDAIQTNKLKDSDQGCKNLNTSKS